MKKYQAYLIGDDGRIAGFDKMTCRNDAEALRKASISPAIASSRFGLARGL
ncbi:hypothetical protein GGQ85_004289 [Nitrobacter vulgaris]|nr:hypothetical protein [Nitrobacter vulgaris]